MTLFKFSGYELPVRVLLALLGIAGALVATALAKVSPSLTTRIIWLFVAQLGLICAELAAGWRILAMVHFAGNLGLRAWQWALSPAVTSYMIKNQHAAPQSGAKRRPARKLQNTIYLLSTMHFKLPKGSKKPFNLV